ncbi:hypothetical protein SNEBB_004851, partial [Seison nebaliae]
MKIIILSLSLVSIVCAYSAQRNVMNSQPMVKPFQTVANQYQQKPKMNPLNYGPPEYRQIKNSQSTYQQPQQYNRNIQNDFQTQTSNICQGKQVNERFPHPTNEGMYIECGFDGQKFERLCPPKTKYVAEYGQCTMGLPLTKPCERVEHACKNGGICENVNDNEYMCECKAGFTGLDCAINIDDCASNPCGSDVCIDLIGGHICLRSLNDGSALIGESPNSLYKSECQITDEPNQFFATQFNSAFYYQCTPQGIPIPKSCHVGCNMNQECVKDPMARCECRIGYTGQFCEVKIDYCKKNPCKNGGVCTSYSSGYSCLCANNFYDDDCSNVRINNPCRLSDMSSGLLLHPHPNDMSKFVSCFGFEAASVLSCPPSLKFDNQLKTCISNEYTNALTNVLEQQKYQASLPKTWQPSGDPLRMPSIASGSANLIPYDASKKQWKNQQVLVQQTLPVKQIQPVIQQTILPMKPLTIIEEPKQVLQMSSWSSSSSNFQKPVV